MAAATRSAVSNPAPIRRWLAAAQNSRAAFTGMWDSNGCWANQQSGTVNNGRRYGHLVGQAAIGLQYKGFGPLTASRSLTNALYSIGYTSAAVPYNVEVSNSYGESLYDSEAASFPPANIAVFADPEANGTAGSFHERLHPACDPRWFPDGDAIESTIGRVAPPVVTLKAGSSIHADALTYRLHYADGTDDSADGANRGKLQPSITTGTATVGTVVNVNTGAITTKNHDQVYSAATGNRANNILFRIGTDTSGSVKGPTMLLGVSIFSNDSGHVLHSVLHSIGGATTAHAKAAVTNVSDEFLVWYLTELARPMGGADAVVCIELCYGVNDEGATYSSIRTDTTAIVTRLRDIWENSIGYDAANLVFLLSVPQPVPSASNETEAAFIAGLGAEYRAIAPALGATVYDATLTATAAEYQSNSWNYSGDTVNHHLSTLGYEQHHTLQWESLAAAAATSTRSLLIPGMAMG